MIRLLPHETPNTELKACRSHIATSEAVVAANPHNEALIREHRQIIAATKEHMRLLQEELDREWDER